MVGMKQWHWPTDEGWMLIAGLSFAGFLMGGWIGLAIMVAFFAFISIMGNLLF